MFGSASSIFLNSSTSASTVSAYAFNSFRNTLVNTTHHDRFMCLKIFVDSDDLELKNAYINAAVAHNQKIMADCHFFDAGFDMFLPQNTHFDMAVSGHNTASKNVNKIDFKIKCCAKIHLLGASDENKSYFSGFYTHPRSSLSKTPLRLANSTGIIDAGYRGNLIGMFDCIWTDDSSTNLNNYSSAKFTRLLQICAPSLIPIYVEIVGSVEELGPITSRGTGGIGSTGI
jgi:dUTP pyrophosphatase